jgi:hypothetical protein
MADFFEFDTGANFGPVRETSGSTFGAANWQRLR